MALPRSRCAHVGQVDERRADDDFGGAGCRRRSAIRSSTSAACLGAAAVHLPVAGHACGRRMSAARRGRAQRTASASALRRAGVDGALARPRPRPSPGSPARFPRRAARRGRDCPSACSTRATAAATPRWRAASKRRATCTLISFCGKLLHAGRELRQGLAGRLHDGQHLQRARSGRRRSWSCRGTAGGRTFRRRARRRASRSSCST